MVAADVEVPGAHLVEVIAGRDVLPSILRGKLRRLIKKRHLRPATRVEPALVERTVYSDSLDRYVFRVIAFEDADGD